MAIIIAPGCLVCTECGYTTELSRRSSPEYMVIASERLEKRHRCDYVGPTDEAAKVEPPALCDRWEQLLAKAKADIKH